MTTISFISRIRGLPPRVEGFLLPLTILVVLSSAWFLYQDWDLLHTSRLEIERLNRVAARNEILLSSLKDLETAQRGYLLTGDASYLKPYQAAKVQIPGQLAALDETVRDPAQRERVRKLRPLIQEKIAEVDSTVLLREQQGAGPALAIVQTDQGQRSMDAIRKLCGEVRDAAFTAIVKNTRDAEQRHDRAKYGILLASGLLVGLQAVALGLIRRAGHRRDQLIHLLENARNHLQVTLSSIGDAVLATDAAGAVTFLNPVAASLTGWKPEEAQGRPIEDILPIVHEFTETPVDNPVRQVIRDHQTIGMANHTKLVRRDGSAVPIDDSAAPIFDSEKQLIGTVLVFRDMTRRRAMSEALDRWEHIFEHAGFGMAILTAGEIPRLEQFNPAFASLHGYTPEELHGKPYSTLVPPDIWSAKSKALRGESGSDHILTESIHLRKDGSRFPVLSDITLVRDQHGKIVYCTCYYSDISDRKRAEQELRASEERYRMTADSLPQLVWTSKPDGTTEYLNSRWQEQTGFTLESAGPDGWTYFLADEDRERVLEAWSQSLASGETFHIDCRFKGRAGREPRWYTCRSVLIRDSTGRSFRWFGSCTDIHEQRQAADLLRSANQALRMSNLDLEQFAYAASHDLQEPLRMVVIYSELLKEEYSDKLSEQGAAYVDFAVDGALRMEQLLKDLLTYSKVTTSDEGYRDTSASSQEALNKALGNLAALIQLSGAEIVLGNLPAVNMPEVQLVQVFQNLIGNSLKYRKENAKPIIHVESQAQNGTWLFSVRDNGIGIAKEYSDHIFGVFRRLHGQDFPGTGIGLALCKKLIERNGGKIWVESTVGEGSTFFFTVQPSSQALHDKNKLTASGR